MTKTALANKERQSREKIAKMQDDRARIEGIKNRGVQVATAGINALGRLGSSVLKHGAGKAPIGLGVAQRNDPAWYKKLPEMKELTTNLPTFQPSGHIFPGAVADRAQGFCPNLMVLYFTNSFGNVLGSDGQVLPATALTINLAAQRYMTELRKYNSRIGEYEPGDLLQFTLACVEVFTYIARVGRMIKLFHYFDAYNPKLRDIAIQSLGFNVTSVSDNIKEFEKLFTLMREETNRLLTVPEDFAYLSRKLLLSSSIYKDGDGNNAQFILTQPLEYYYYDETNARLSPLYRAGSGQQWTYSGIRNAYNSLIGNLINSNFCVTLMADIRSAAGLKLYQMPDVDLHECDVKPIDEVLTQFMNAELAPCVGSRNFTSPSSTVYMSVASNNSADYLTMDPEAAINNMETTVAAGTKDTFPHYYLKQDSNGFLIPTEKTTDTTAKPYRIWMGHTTTPSSTWDAAAVVFNKAEKLLNFYKNEVSDDDILEATRLIPVWKAASNDVEVSGDYDCYFEVVGCATEIPIGVMLGSSLCGWFDVGFKFFDYNLHEFFAFNYHPTTYVMQTTGGPSNLSGQIPLQQWNKLVLAPKNNLYWLHEVATKSEIYIEPPHGFERVK